MSRLTILWGPQRFFHGKQIRMEDTCWPRASMGSLEWQSLRLLIWSIRRKIFLSLLLLVVGARLGTGREHNHRLHMFCVLTSVAQSQNVSSSVADGSRWTKGLTVKGGALLYIVYGHVKAVRHINMTLSHHPRCLQKSSGVQQKPIHRSLVRDSPISTEAGQ